MKGNKKSLLLWLLAIWFISSCGGTSSSPLEKLKKIYDRYPEFSIILADMREEGLFFKDYFHLYHVVYLQPDPKDPGKPIVHERLTPWYRVGEKIYNKYRSCLGMTVLAKKKDGTISDVPQPPAYQFVGDPRFGRWVTDQSGNKMWEWFGRYLVLSALIEATGDITEGLLKRRHRVRYDDWYNYTVYTRRGRPYYGPRDYQGRPTYGTSGTITQKKYGDSFFARQRARMSAKKSAFHRKVASRYGRSRAFGRSGVGFFGK